MKTLWNLAIVPAAAALLALPALQEQEQEREKDGRARELAPVDPSEETSAQEDSRPAPSLAAERWKAGLSSSSLEERERAWQDLLHTARRDPGAMLLLREWADDESDTDLAWNARLALRELSLTRGPLTSFTDPLRGLDRLRMPFGDPFARLPDVSRLLEDVQRQLDGLLQPGTPFGAPPQGRSMQSQTFELESGPDGVKVRVHEDVDGQSEVKTYEADSLEELLDAYPELRERIRISPLSPLSPGAPGLPGDARQSLEDLLGRLRDSPFGAGPDPFDRFDRFDPFGSRPSGPVPTDRLGILMREPGSYGASVEGVEPGVGLLVERVLPHSIAGELGLQPGDILTELNGRKLWSADDVRRALSARKAEEPVVLKLVDSLGQERTVTWEPAEQEPTKGPVPLKRRAL